MKSSPQKAHEYLIYRDELRGLDVNIFLMEYDQIHTEMEDVSRKQDIASADLENARKEFEETKNEYAQVEEILEKQNQKPGTEQGKPHDIPCILKRTGGKCQGAAGADPQCRTE